MKKFSTTASQETKLSPLTIEELKKACDAIIEKEEKPLPKGLSWFTKLMNRFGWHRKYTLLVIDKSKLFDIDRRSFITHPPSLA